MNYVRAVGAVKAAAFEGKPAARTEQRPGRRIGEQHPRGAIDQHHTPLQALKPFRGGIMVEIGASEAHDECERRGRCAAARP